MTKDVEQAQIGDGPFLAVAALCQSVLQEKDDLISCIRFIDKIDASGSNEKMPKMPLSLSAFVSFKSGGFKGTKLVELELISPSGKLLDPKHRIPAVFEGAEHGYNIALSFTLITDETGLYWFNVSLDGSLVTRIPLRITYVQKTDQVAEAGNLTKPD